MDCRVKPGNEPRVIVSRWINVGKAWRGASRRRSGDRQVLGPYSASGGSGLDRLTNIQVLPKSALVIGAAEG
jgi:hypothetical protein